MKKYLLAVVFAFAIFTFAKGQKHPDFKVKHSVKVSSVKSQGRTGTCWAYATVSFLESEALRMGKKEYDLSEMYIVRNVYPKKAELYVRNDKLSNFSEGGQAHDVTNALLENGIVPESVYKGIKYNSERHNHSKMVKNLKNILEVYLKRERREIIDQFWINVFNAVLDTYLGVLPEKFKYDNKDYTPKSFAKELGLSAENYIEFTSYTHHPFYTKYDIEVQDNWSHDDYYNVPVDELIQIMDNALKNGYSISWDGDMSEKSFKHREGKAVFSAEEMAEIKKVGFQKHRQITFNNFKTTDDHLMHITGIATDSKGNKYYQTKNSWGDKSNEYGGFLYMAEDYVKIKTIAFMVHKDAVPSAIKKKLNIK